MCYNFNVQFQGQRVKEEALARTLCGTRFGKGYERFVLCTQAISRHAATSPHNIQRRNFTDCFNRSVSLVRLCTSSLRMVEDRNM